MTEQEYKYGKERYENYSYLNHKLNQLNVMKKNIDSLGIYQISVGKGDIKCDISSMGDEAKVLIETYLKAVIEVQIVKIREEMEKI